MSLENTKKWFEVAIPKPTIKTACVQIGCAYEETAELALALGDEQLERIADSTACDYKVCNRNEATSLAILMNSEHVKLELLDAIVDEIVTRVGIAHNLGFDILGALEEVNRSNFSKFEDGKPVFDANGKITKGKNYVKPNLKRFV